MRVLAAALAFATSAFALTVTYPTNSSGWNNDGANTVTWTRVSTDPKNFTVVLVNKSVFPNYEQVLNALVQSGDAGGTINVNAPSTGWPSGTGFQVNLAADSQHIDNLLAQSDQFTFHAPTGSSIVPPSSGGSSSTLSISNTALSPSQPTNSLNPSNTDSNGPLNPDATTSDVNTTPTTNGASAMGAQAALFGLVALVGAALA